MIVGALLTAAVMLSQGGATADPSAGPTREVKAAQEYLRGKYDDFEPMPNGEFHIYGLAYVQEWAPLTPLSVGAVQSYLPDTHFYQTIVHTPNYEYLKVETLVAVTPQSAGFDVRSCLSPTYDEVSTRFL